jgi:hypothetical protein
MSNNAAWLLLSFAVMVVAVLATLHDRLEKLEKRLEVLEPPGRHAMTDREVVGGEER